MNSALKNRAGSSWRANRDFCGRRAALNGRYHE